MSPELKQLIVWCIPGLPLLAAVLTACLGPAVLRGRSHLPCCWALLLAFLCSCMLLTQIVPEGFAPTEHSASSEHTPNSVHTTSAAAHPAEVHTHTAAVSTAFVATGYEWLSVGDMHVRLDLRADAMTAIMLVMVTGVSLLVSIFGSGYMHHDPGYPRFFAVVSLFVCSMCLLLLAGNFVVLFMFWEAVGLCSYLLIGFWFQKPSAAAAAKKAFVVNRIGDLGLLLGMFLIWTTFGSLDFEAVLGNTQLLSRLAATDSTTLTTICLLLFLGAMGKSAQFPLSVWLPDAMEGPTPVSALIHAATMVTAGVYLVARCTPLFVLAPDAQMVVSVIGAITALVAALTALTQTDLKKVLAYSTVSQLGFMFMSLGAGAAGGEVATLAVTAAMFHLFTHAFFKALLFLSAGSVMHAMGDVIDMRRFSGLRRILPVTHWTFLCGAAALAGLPLLSGFWSKDDILAVLGAAANDPERGTVFTVIYFSAIVTALLTAFYTFRAYLMTFWGAERIPEEAGHHAHESPPVMAWPLRLLAVAAVGVGLLLGPSHLFASYLSHTTGLMHVESHGLHWGVMILSTLIALAGTGLAWFCYVQSPGIPVLLANTLGPLYQLSLHKFYLDEVLSFLVVRPLRGLAKWGAMFDQRGIDGLVDAIGSIPKFLSQLPRNVHDGVVSHYALVMLSGVLLCLLLLTASMW